jgi:hypothetical protein
MNANSQPDMATYEEIRFGATVRNNFRTAGKIMLANEF